MNSNRDYATENINLKKRLETLEKENQSLHNELHSLMCYGIGNAQKDLLADNELLRQENEKLKQQVKDLENNQETVLTTLEIAVQQNEKLKKVINIFNDKTNIGVDRSESDNKPYVYSDYGDSKITQQEYELLKEVLGE